MSFLVEPGIESFIQKNLKNCQTFKQEYYNSMINISLFVFFVTFTSAILLYKYKGKPTPQQLEEKNVIKQNYIMDKIQKTHDEKQRLNEELITDLPHWNRDFYAFL
jgi:hypothetical protein